ncbi:MAG: mechanosensitive ion channel domain-containing protein, partial [Acidimicrobiales bacterium]
VILGIAAQSSLGNVFAGIVLVLARPFTVGDHIRVRSGALGGLFDAWVVDVSLAYVTLRTDDGLLKVPNLSMLAAGVLALTPDSAPLPAPVMPVGAPPAPAGGGAPAAPAGGAPGGAPAGGGAPGGPPGGGGGGAADGFLADTLVPDEAGGVRPHDDAGGVHQHGEPDDAPGTDGGDAGTVVRPPPPPPPPPPLPPPGG